MLAVIFNRYYAGVIAGGADGVDIAFFGWDWHVHGTALFNFVIAFAMFIVAVISPFLGAWADGRASKKKFLAGYIVLGVFSTAMLATAGPGEWLWGAFWFILADIGFAGGNVFYNAFLRELASPDEMGKVSGWGWGTGYLGGGLLLMINLLMLQSPEIIGLPIDYFTVHHTFLSVAIWWGLFSIPLLVNVKERAIPSGSDRGGIGMAVRRLKSTFRQIKSYKDLVRFLVAYLFFNDGIETVIIMAAIFGDQELGMNQQLLIGYFLMIQFTALIGSLLFGKLTDVIGNKTSLLITLVVWCLVVIFAYFIGWSGNPVTEFFILGIIAGIVMGASQSIARAMQGTFTPPGHEAEFFAFFSISGRFAAIFGPLTYGIVVLVTGSLRFGILSLILFFVVGMILLIGVNENEGRRAAEAAMDSNGLAANG
ncbi:MAG: MFS transporter [Candidatus Electryonea clarkiae]|nr:MFS transporter [Candidatus Electryonea clarkiae]MDP8285070.1 MFS transporter [Candidatus Electryonea clarkiae]